MDKVATGIFVGTEGDAGNESLLREHGVETVVSLTHSTPDTGPVNCVDVPMIDGPQNDPADFANAVAEVVRHRETGHTVLIHCSAGSSRSPSVAAAALTCLTELTLNVRVYPEDATAGTA